MKIKKTITVLLTITIVLSTLIIPMTANALKSSANVNITNQLEWEIGKLNDSGEPVAHNNFIRTDFFNVSKYSKLDFTGADTSFSHNIYWYDENKQFIKKETASKTLTSTYTVENNYSYAKIILYYGAEIITPEFSSNLTSLMATPLVDASLIDANKTGTLRIHKYEMQNVSAATTPGTGYSTDSANVPQNASPLAGVTFRVTKVAEVNSTYYTTAGTALPTATQAKAMQAIGSPRTATTNASGNAEFTNLPLGIYLVEETDSPSQVVGAVADFVVPLPMTSSDGSEWKYDVDVYPKNETRYQEITLEKKDYNTGSPIQNAVFKLEKSTNNSTWSTIQTGLTTGQYGTVTPTNPLAVKAYYRFIETSAASGYILDNDNKSATFYINENGQVCNPTTKDVLDSTNPYRVTMTNSKPSIEKFIDKSRGENTDLVKASSITKTSTDLYQYYVIKVTTPNVTNMSKLRTFKVNDIVYVNSAETTPSVVKVTYGEGTVLASSNYSFTSFYSPSPDRYSTSLTFTTSALTKNTDYYITMKVQLRKDTSNTATLQYSTNTESDDTTSIPSDEVNFYKYGYKFTKIDAANNNPLQGAEFKLFRSEEDAQALRNPVKACQNSDSTTVQDTFTSNANGEVIITYLDCGDTGTGEETFYVVETKAPAGGYNLLSEPFTITVNHGTLNSSQMNVKNSKKINLPLTGGQGIVTFSIIGIVLISTGVVLAVYLKNKKRKITIVK